MPLFSDYTHRENFFFRLDPRTKLVWLGAVSLAGLTAPSPVIPALLALLVVVTGWRAGLELRAFQLLGQAVAILALPVFLLQAVFRPGGQSLAEVGPLVITSEPLQVTVQVVLGLLCLSLAFVQFVLWTHPTDLAQVLVQLGLRYRYAMLLSLALRFFPVLEQEIAAIMDAQAARGLELEGSVRRALRLVPIMLPLCLRTIRRSSEVALAMELKGYGYAPTRTFLRQIAFRPVDRAATGLVLAAFLVYWAARMVGS